MDSVALALFRFFSRTRQKAGAAVRAPGAAPHPHPHPHECNYVFVYIAGQDVYVHTWQVHKASGLREIPYSELYSQQYVVFVDRHGCISIALAEPRVLSEK